MSRVSLDTTVRNEAGRLITGLDLYALTRGDPTRADAVDGSDPAEVAAFVGGETEIDVYAARTGGSPLTQPLESYSEDSDFYWVDPASVDKYVPSDEKNPITPVEAARGLVAVSGTHAARLAATADAGLLWKESNTGLIYRGNGASWDIWKGDGIIYKAADETVSNSNTPQADDALLFPVEANEVWFFEIYLLLQAVSTTADWLFGLSGPALATANWGPLASAAQGTGGTFLQTGAGNSPGATVAIGGTVSHGGISGTQHLALSGWFFNGANAGNLGFLWSQNTATVENNKVLKGSHLRVRRLA